jgi:hypothetical protein
MDNFPITVSKDKAVHHFEVGEHPHHSGEGCKFRVYEHGVFVAAFEPDSNEFLHICKNPGGLDEEILYLLADQIEAHHPRGINDNVRKLKSKP